MKTKTAADLMSRNLVTATEAMRLTEVIKIMLDHKVSCLPVVDTDGNLRGIITEYDVVNFAFSGEADRTTVSESMSRNIITFAPTDDLETIVNICVTRRLHRAPVVENGRVLGMLSRRDVLREILDIYQAHKA